MAIILTNILNLPWIYTNILS